MISAIVCAAGLSKRMGQQNKCLLPYKGKPILLHTLEQIIKSKADEVILVLGYEEDKVRDKLHSVKENIRIVVNERFIEGQTSSIQQGVSATDDHSKGYIICLADMPLISTDQYNDLLDSYNDILREIDHPIVRPISKKNGRKGPGHPVIMHRYYREEILSCSEKEGCRSVIKKAGKSYVPITVDQPSYFIDVDTPEAYQQLISNNRDS